MTLICVMNSEYDSVNDMIITNFTLTVTVASLPTNPQARREDKRVELGGFDVLDWFKGSHATRRAARWRTIMVGVVAGNEVASGTERGV